MLVIRRSLRLSINIFDGYKAAGIIPDHGQDGCKNLFGAGTPTRRYVLTVPLSAPPQYFTRTRYSPSAGAR
jgi:hypothetical protein